MNIFITNENPRECASYLDDKRVTKMCLETAQMLSTAIYHTLPELCTVCEYSPLVKNSATGKYLTNVRIKKVYYFLGSKIYVPTHKNHPCNVWARETKGNYQWLLRHFFFLCQEFARRRGKIHASHDLLPTFIEAANHFSNEDMTPFVNCAANKSKGLDYKSVPDIFRAYKIYLSKRWDLDVATPTWYGKKMF